ncbi:OmcA/MtrC family decaheme c-type cytochrome [Shewanella mangrovisoli]|uniref:OmcA/MtrC family decaheme c-type cytochrome n=1 Tax=Shewanella mangrovisoli TaxID=2864211 RepID=UPI0035BA7CFD
MMKNYNKSLLALALTSALCLTACGDGKDGQDGAPGTPGIPGTPGTPGLPAGSFAKTADSITDLKFTLSPADIKVTSSEGFSVKFSLTGKSSGKDVPFMGLDKIALYSLTANENTSGTGAPIEWQNNAMANNAGTSLTCTLNGLNGTKNACTLTEDTANPGTYTATWTYDGAAPIINPNDNPNAVHRVFLRAYNIVNAAGVALSDKVLSVPVDFIPATDELAASGKDTVSSAACKNCHGEVDGHIAKIEAHHNYQDVKNCVTCHNPDQVPSDAQLAEGWVFDFAPMIHRIHAGEHNADYLSGEAKEYFGEIGFPSDLKECKSCHDGEPSYNTNIYAQACVGCHINVNFATGENHSEFGLAQADDTQCKSCHGSGSLTPEAVHSVGKRAEYASLMTVDFTSATLGTSAVAGMQSLTLKANVTLNGAAIADGTSLKTYNATSNPTAILAANGLLLGNVATDGTVYSWRDVKPTAVSLKLENGTLSGGVLTFVKDIPDAQATGTIYVGSEANFCAKAGKVVSCNTEGLEYGPTSPVGNTSAVKFFNLSGGTPAVARMNDPARITVEEAKCNACHGSLDYAKGYRHGVYTFDQCMNCHNDTTGASGHGATGYKGEDGKLVVNPDVTFNNKDLFTVAHRFHSGNFGVVEGIFRNAAGELEGYPSPETACSACHKDGATLFAADGGLTSGKRSIKVGSNYISPVAESCRTCHAHSDAAAVAHFRSNGAIVEADAVTDPNLPVESCATCHAEGKTYGIDKVHAEVAH